MGRAYGQGVVEVDHAVQEAGVTAMVALGEESTLAALVEIPWLTGGAWLRRFVFAVYSKTSYFPVKK